MRPIDADALYRQVKTECNPYGKPTIGFEDGKKVLKWIESAPTIGGWISVKDSLPERKWTDCLVATRILPDGPRGFNIAWLNDDNGNWSSNDEWICNKKEIVTHWKPLPELPEEKNK